MKLDNSFRVALPVDDAWALLTDLPRIAPCLPGAHLDDIADGEYRGGLFTRIGPISVKYTGTARFIERDEVDHRAVIEACGREQRGHGAASGTIVATLRPDGPGTLVEVSTELAISGRAAQFGRSLLAEISTTMLTEFTRRLAVTIESGHQPAAPLASAAPMADDPGPGRDNSLDVLGTLVIPLLRRAIVPTACFALGGLLGWGLSRWRRGGGCLRAQQAFRPHPQRGDKVFEVPDRTLILGEAQLRAIRTEHQTH